MSPSEEDLKKSVEHIEYSLNMLGTFTRSFEAVQILNVNVANLVLEGGLLHLRSLLEFFYARPPKKQHEEFDLQARTYLGREPPWSVPEWYVVPKATTKENNTGGLKARLDQHLAHLTTGKLKKRSWDDELDLSLPDITARWEEFLNTLESTGSERRAMFTLPAVIQLDHRSSKARAARGAGFPASRR